MNDNPGENRRLGLTPREVIFVDIVRDGIRRAHKAAERVNRRHRGALSVQPALSTTYIRHHNYAGKPYDFDAADLDGLPEIYFFIATVPFDATHSGEAVAKVDDTVMDMVRCIERGIEQEKAARGQGAS